MFTFNGKYQDIEQVAEHLPAFMAVFEQVKRGNFAYDADFLGRIPAIGNTERRGPNVGTHEEAAIYLLQRLRRARELTAKVEELLADGYEHVEYIDGETRCRHVIFYSDPYKSFCGEWQEWRDARLIPEDRPMRDGESGNFIGGVLPKGKRTHGHRPNGRRVLVLR